MQWNWQILLLIILKSVRYNPCLFGFFFLVEDDEFSHKKQTWKTLSQFISPFPYTLKDNKKIQKNSFEKLILLINCKF